jgi:chemotaxis protein CheD
VSQPVYLHPGQLHAAAGPVTITTILGSCVAVCLFDRTRGIGGTNHYLLPHHADEASGSPRFGNVAMRRLLDDLLALGARRFELEAKLFGGACVLDAFRGNERHLGAQNVAAARMLLDAESIPVRAEDVGGRRGRKLVFRVDDGTALVKLL